jgi:hypothetical protein
MEKLRKLLEVCNVKQDIQTFIQTHGTGETIPAPVEYQNYYTTDTQTAQPSPPRQKPTTTVPTMTKPMKPCANMTTDTTLGSAERVAGPSGQQYTVDSNSTAPITRNPFVAQDGGDFAVRQPQLVELSSSMKTKNPFFEQLQDPCAYRDII